MRDIKLTDDEMCAKIMKAVQYWDEKLQELLGFAIEYDVDCSRFGRSFAGWATFGKTLKVRYNLDYVEGNLAKYLDTTVPHELCHLYALRKYGEDVAHGQRWKRLMRSIGVSPNRCADYDSSEVVPARKITRYVYILSCGCDYEVTKKIHEVSQSAFNIPGYGYLCKKHRVEFRKDDYYAVYVWGGKIREKVWTYV